MSPLAYVCARPQRNAAEAEYASFRSAMRLGADELEMIDLVADDLPEDAIDRWRGFVVGGSPFNVTDPEPSKTGPQRRLETALARIATAAAAGRTAVVFTCYGIGIASRTLGGEVSRAYPEDTGPAPVTLTDDGRRDPLFGELAPTFTALTAHKEGTERMPAGAVLLATGAACPVQAYRVGDRLYATQFHPEATAQAFTERMAIYRDDGYFDSADYDEIAARVHAASVSEPVRLLRAFARVF